MPLYLSNCNEETKIVRVGGNPETRQHLSNLGFVAGSDIKIINEVCGNYIVGIKGARIAISKEMAAHIFVK
ncbi:MAG: ferrous iron transport protein A [Clostridia bacterium]|nr:ferrous iron transport protein A [Clostridia bacterium]